MGVDQNFIIVIDKQGGSLVASDFHILSDIIFIGEKKCLHILHPIITIDKRSEIIVYTLRKLAHAIYRDF